MKTTLKQRRALQAENAKFGMVLERIPREDWGSGAPEGLLAVWRSYHFLVQVFLCHGAVCRLSVCRTKMRGNGRWEENITWDDLQRLKREAGFGEYDAVEIYPQDRDLVNVASMRHLFVMNEPFELAWRKKYEANVSV